VQKLLKNNPPPPPRHKTTIMATFQSFSVSHFSLFGAG
jgi:hypothetical protein